MNDITFEDIISRLESVQLFPKYAATKCVFHSDSNPSMLVFKDGWFRCLGCGRNGNWKTLWNKLRGQPIVVRPERRTSFGQPPIFGRDLEYLCESAHDDLCRFESFQWYMEMRGLSDRIEINEIGYVQGWYTFPVRDKEGIFKTAVFRAAPHIAAVTDLRYWCNSAPLPYVPDWNLLDKSSYVFVVYGIMDALTLSDLRHPVMTSTAGNNTFKADWLNDYRKPIFIIPDQGEDKQARILANALGWRAKIINPDYPAGIKDMNGFYEKGKKETLAVMLQNIVSKETTPYDPNAFTTRN